MSLRKQIILHLLLLAGILAAFELTGLDLAVQDRFYLGQRRWLVDPKWKVPRLVFYDGPKVLLVAFGGACLAGWIGSYRLKRWRALRLPSLRMALALAIIPVTVAGLKAATNVYTPAQTQRYGGPRPYVKVLERYPQDAKRPSRGKGWPAAHASGGFALMMLYHALRRRGWRVGGLCLGLAAGWTMGLYHTLDGAHFLSHTFVTMSLAWIIVLLIVLLSDARQRASLFTAIGRRRRAGI